MGVYTIAIDTRQSISVDIDSAWNQSVEMGMASVRTHLGSHFSEGARLLWVAMEERGWKIAQLTKALSARPGMLPRWLYGDQRPRWEWATKLRDTCGIPLEAWTLAPRAPFVVPALREAESSPRMVAEDSATGTDD